MKSRSPHTECQATANRPAKYIFQCAHERTSLREREPVPRTRLQRAARKPKALEYFLQHIQSKNFLRTLEQNSCSHV